MDIFGDYNLTFISQDKILGHIGKTVSEFIDVNQLPSNFKCTLLKVANSTGYTPIQAYGLLFLMLICFSLESIIEEIF